MEVKAREATPQELKLTHSPVYIDRIINLRSEIERSGRPFIFLDSCEDTYACRVRFGATEYSYP